MGDPPCSHEIREVKDKKHVWKSLRTSTEVSAEVTLTITQRSNVTLVTLKCCLAGERNMNLWQVTRTQWFFVCLLTASCQGETTWSLRCRLIRLCLSGLMLQVYPQCLILTVSFIVQCCFPCWEHEEKVESSPFFSPPWAA
jgi:hypothetical protein